ncbi:Branched-chain-amino-acid aminotransferase, cytosolic, partial [Plecturocebus cupreus]
MNVPFLTDRLNKNAEIRRLSFIIAGKESRISFLKSIRQLGTVAHACNPSTWWEAEAGGSQGQEFKTSLAYIPSLGVKKPTKALLFVILSPVGPYFSSGTFNPVSLWANPKYVRAWEGGTGDCKMGGNYGSSLFAQCEAVDNGCQQVLWLYGEDNQITEVGTMNLFLYWINEDGEEELATPPLDGIILPGVTRQCILDLAHQWGEFKVSERYLTMDDLTTALEENRVREMFGSGTACVVCPVSDILYKGEFAENDGFQLKMGSCYVAQNGVQWLFTEKERKGERKKQQKKEKKRKRKEEILEKERKGERKKQQKKEKRMKEKERGRDFRKREKEKERNSKRKNKKRMKERKKEEEKEGERMGFLVSAERSAVSLMGFPLWVTRTFSLAALSIFSFISTLKILIIHLLKPDSVSSSHSSSVKPCSLADEELRSPFSFGALLPHRAGPSGFSCASQSSALPIAVLLVGMGPAAPDQKGTTQSRTLRTEKRRAGQKSRAGDLRGSLAGNLPVRGHQIFVCNCGPLALCALTASHNPELLLRGHFGSLSARFPLADAGSPLPGFAAPAVKLSVLSASNCCFPCGDGTSRARPSRTLCTGKRRA